MSGRALAAVACVLALWGPACGRARSASPDPAQAATLPVAQSTASDCGHALCADNFFVDAAPGGACAASSTCTVRLTLVATGDFHVNDQYPYRFKADDTAGVAFLGTDQSGKNVFSKAAGDWLEVDPKSGAMTIKFSPAGRGQATVGGVFKLSVCSGQTCQLEQSRLSVPVAIN